MPDETTTLNFRHFLEQHGLGKALFNEVNKHLEKNSLMLREGNIVDAPFISAPSSTMNKNGKRDPEIHQATTGNEWLFGMKMGVDDTLGMIHSIDALRRQRHDIVSTDKLLHGDEQRVFGDAGYLGVQKWIEHKHCDGVSWLIAKLPGARKKLDAGKLKGEEIKTNVRAKVEHPLRYIKQVFGYARSAIADSPTPIVCTCWLRSVTC